MSFLSKRPFLQILIVAVLVALPVGLVHAKSSRRGCPAGMVISQTNAKKNETLKSLSKRLNVKSAEIKRLNRLRGDRVVAGQNIRYCIRKAVPESLGRPNSGKLSGGVSLDADGDNEGTGFVISDHRIAIFGTRNTVENVKDCARRYRRQFRKGAPINIGDLSAKGGGELGKHLSHQSGRDVDFGFMTIPPQSRGSFDRKATSTNLDVQKQWFIVRCLLDKGDIQYIFASHSIVNALKKYVSKNGALRAKYLKYFPGGRKAVIVGDTEHHTHMHVRFRCPKSDRNCVD